MNTIDFHHLVAGANGFFLHFLAAIALCIVFAICYLWLTPYPEFRLIREGKTAPAISLSGALVGFALALSGAISNSVSFTDMLIWASVALFVQMLVFGGVRALLADLCERIANDEIGPAVLLAGLAISAGLLNAACMSY